MYRSHEVDRQRTTRVIIDVLSLKTMSPLFPSPIITKAPLTTNISTHIPENFTDFLPVFHEKIIMMEHKFRLFLSVSAPLKYEFSSQLSSFAFSPVDRVIHIPEKWIRIFHVNLQRTLQSEFLSGPQFAYTWEDLFFALFHELSHYRDFLKESEKTGRASMKIFLDKLQNEHILYGTDTHILI